jgi:hypothetical protein
MEKVKNPQREEIYCGMCSRWTNGDFYIDAFGAAVCTECVEGK